MNETLLLWHQWSETLWHQNEQDFIVVASVERDFVVASKWTRLYCCGIRGARLCGIKMNKILLRHQWNESVWQQNERYFVICGIIETRLYGIKTNETVTVASVEREFVTSKWTRLCCCCGVSGERLCDIKMNETLLLLWRQWSETLWHQNERDFVVAASEERDCVA